VSTTSPPTELVFSYGTLQLEAVQLATFGRKLVGTADVLPGFAQSMMKIDDPDVVATSTLVTLVRADSSPSAVARVQFVVSRVRLGRRSFADQIFADRMARQVLDRRRHAAEGAVGVASQTHLAETHAEGIVRQQAPDQRLTE